MRIAVTADPFIPVPPINYGGIERIIHFLVEGLAKRGHEVVLIAHAESKVNVPLIQYPPLKESIAGHIKNALTINRLKAWKPEVIHSFSRLAYLLPFFGSRVPKLMSYQREPTIPQIKKVVSFFKKDTIAFTGCSAYISDQIKPYAPSYAIFNGIDLNIYTFQALVERDAPLVFLGRIEPVKGTHIAIEVAQRTKKPLIIAGNIPKEHQAYFDQKVKPHLDEKIQYIGPVNDAQKNDLLGKASAFLMPIEWNEPFGIVMAEAMACGTPVIGLKRGAVHEVVIDGWNGFACNTVDELIQAVDNVSAIDRRKVREDAEKRFSAEVIIDQYESLYKALTINKI
jgi:glycosyltransferase involved in cell wall biosynthesis